MRRGSILALGVDGNWTQFWTVSKIYTVRSGVSISITSQFLLDEPLLSTLFATCPTRSFTDERGRLKIPEVVYLEDVTGRCLLWSFTSCLVNPRRCWIFLALSWFSFLGLHSSWNVTSKLKMFLVTCSLWTREHLNNTITYFGKIMGNYERKLLRWRHVITT